MQSKGLPVPVFGGEQSLGALYVDDPLVRREVSADVTTIDYPPGPSIYRDTIGFLHGVDVPRDPEQPMQLHFVQAAHGRHGDLADRLGVDHLAGIDVRLQGPGSRLAKIVVSYAIGNSRPGVNNPLCVQFDQRNHNRHFIADRTTYALSRAVISLLGPHMLSSLPASERDTTSLELFAGRPQGAEYEGRLSAANLSDFELTRPDYSRWTHV